MPVEVTVPSGGVADAAARGPGGRWTVAYDDLAAAALTQSCGASP